MCWDTQAPLHLEPPPRLILFLRVFRGCFYTAILSQTLCGYAFKTHISSSPNRSDSFIIWKRWHIFKRFLSLLRLELIASIFFLRCCSAIQWCLLQHKRFLSKRSYQHKTGIIKLIATGRERQNTIRGNRCNLAGEAGTVSRILKPDFKFRFRKTNFPRIVPWRGNIPREELHFIVFVRCYQQRDRMLVKEILLFIFINVL